MLAYPPDLAPVVLAAAGAVVLTVTACHVLAWSQTRTPRLRLLTGTRSQRTALRASVSPVLREFLPSLTRAGQEVRAIVLVPTLSGNDGETVASEVEQLGQLPEFVILLAHRAGPGVRPPEAVAGVLAEDLLYLYRQRASVSVVRQTLSPAAPSAAQRVERPNAVVPVSHQPTQNKAEETVI